MPIDDHGSLYITASTRLSGVLCHEMGGEVSGFTRPYGINLVHWSTYSSLISSLQMARVRVI